MTQPHGGLGWKPSQDPRNFNFLTRAVMHPLAESIAELINYKMYWANGWWGNQLSTSQCVIYSWLHLIADGPVTHPGLLMPFKDPTGLYHIGQGIDGSTGNEESGLTCLAGAKVMQQEGVIREYRWAYSLKDLLDALAFTPVTFGLNWYTKMFDPDSTGLIKIGGVVEGGHQVVLNGFNRKTGLVRGKNSWGRNWGRGGLFHMTFEDVSRHFSEGAEACVATELLKFRLPPE